MLFSVIFQLIKVMLELNQAIINIFNGVIN